MKTLMLIIAFVFVLVGGQSDSVITKDSTWVDSRGCYHTITSTYQDSVGWVESDSVLFRCPNGIEGTFWKNYSY